MTKIKYGSENDWFDLYEKTKKTNFIDEKVVYANALAATTNINLLKL